MRVSSLCFGTMCFGGEADEAESAVLFGRCRDAGINLFDCADVYQRGVSEEILGRLVADGRDEIVLATKAYFPMGDDPNARGSSRYHLVRAVEASLRRLGTDRIDVFYLHRFDDATPLEETLRALEDLVRSGKVLYPAASNFAAWQAARAVGVADANGWSRLTCLQPMYNLVKRQAEVEILPFAAAEGLAVLPYGPLGGGLLSGKYGTGKRPGAGRLVDNAMYQVRYGEPGYLGVADRFVALAAEHGHHPAALAVAWVRGHPAVTAPIIGARNLVQLDVLLESVDIRMTSELRAAVSALSATPPPATDRNEEGGTHDYRSVLRETGEAVDG